MARKVTKFTSHSKEVRDLNVTAAEASKAAIKESMDLGLSVTFVEDHKVIRKSPDGEQQVIKELTSARSASKRLKKGMVLCRK